MNIDNIYIHVLTAAHTRISSKCDGGKSIIVENNNNRGTCVVNQGFQWYVVHRRNDRYPFIPARICPFPFDATISFFLPLLHRYICMYVCMYVYRSSLLSRYSCKIDRCVSRFSTEQTSGVILRIYHRTIKRD